MLVAYACAPTDGRVAPAGSGAGGEGGADAVTVGTGGHGGGSACDPGSPSVDDDLDGVSEEDGDCNDCDPNANPNAIEVIADPGSMTDPADEDCDGAVDEPFEPCDDGLALDSVDPYEAARALDLCQLAGDGADWGVVSALYVNADGTPARPTVNVGLLPKLGDHLVPRAGSTMLGLSSGHARDPSQPDNCGGLACGIKNGGVAPPGFPQPVPGCVTPSDINDDVALEVVLRPPSNALGYAFDFAFFSSEFPRWVCTGFNDQFVVLADPAPRGSVNGNVAFDDEGHPVSVNLTHFDHCDPVGIADYALQCVGPCPSPPDPYCPHGPELLAGTGFDVWTAPGRAGSTGWLTTTAPITPGEALRIRFAIWDAGDSALDSTVVIDHVRWLAKAAAVETVPLLE